MASEAEAKGEVATYRRFLKDEENAVLLYTALADAEKDERLSRVFRMLAQTEGHHAAEWRKRLEEAGESPGTHRADLKTRLLLLVARRLGTAAVLPSVLAMESAGTDGYQGVASAAGMAADERSHGKVLRAMRAAATGGIEGGTLAQAEGRHRGAGGNALRAAVLGANDGLVSNLSLVMGVAGAGLAARSIVITGFAGLLGGAISMALGEWLSVQSSRELFTHQIDIERAEIAASPEEEAEELALIYQARGISETRARELASDILSNGEAAVETLAREELGIDPKELGGSAWVASISSFFMFAAGAVIPVIAFLFLSGLTAVITSVCFAVVGLFTVGAVTSLSTSRSLLFSAARMVVFGVAAALVTFGVGHLFGVAIAG